MKKDRGAGSILIIAEIIALVVVLVFGAVKYIRQPEEPKQTYTAREPVTEEKEDLNATEKVAETETEAEPEEVTVTFSDEVLTQVATMTDEQKVAQLFLTSGEPDADQPGDDRRAGDKGGLRTLPGSRTCLFQGEFPRQHPDRRTSLRWTALQHGSERHLSVTCSDRKWYGRGTENGSLFLI